MEFKVPEPRRAPARPNTPRPSQGTSEQSHHGRRVTDACAEPGPSSSTLDVADPQRQSSFIFHPWSHPDSCLCEDCLEWADLIDVDDQDDVAEDDVTIDEVVEEGRPIAQQEDEEKEETQQQQQPPQQQQQQQEVFSTEPSTILSVDTKTRLIVSSGLNIAPWLGSLQVPALRGDDHFPFLHHLEIKAATTIRFDGDQLVFGVLLRVPVDIARFFRFFLDDLTHTTMATMQLGEIAPDRTATVLTQPSFPLGAYQTHNNFDVHAMDEALGLIGFGQGKLILPHLEQLVETIIEMKSSAANASPQRLVSPSGSSPPSLTSSSSSSPSPSPSSPSAARRHEDLPADSQPVSQDQYTHPQSVPSAASCNRPFYPLYRLSPESHVEIKSRMNYVSCGSVEQKRFLALNFHFTDDIEEVVERWLSDKPNACRVIVLFSALYQGGTIVLAPRALAPWDAPALLEEYVRTNRMVSCIRDPTMRVLCVTTSDIQRLLLGLLGFENDSTVGERIWDSLEYFAIMSSREAQLGFPHFGMNPAVYIKLHGLVVRCYNPKAVRGPSESYKLVPVEYLQSTLRRASQLFYYEAVNGDPLT